MTARSRRDRERPVTVSWFPAEPWYRWPGMPGAPTQDMTTNNAAVETVHTMTMRDGTVVTTTWHDTRAEANARIAAPAVASFRKVFAGGVLGAFRAVTWS